MEYDRSTSPEQLRWYLDGNNYFTLTSNSVNATTWNNASHHGMFVILNVAIGGSGVSGLVEVRVDSRRNSPIGSFAFGGTGGWQTWQSIPGNAANVTGRHTVYLTFTSGQPADFVNVNWIQFRR